MSKVLHDKLGVYLQKQGFRVGGGHFPDTGPVSVFVKRHADPSADWQERLREYLLTQGARLDLVRDHGDDELQIRAEDVEFPASAPVLRAAAEIGAVIALADQMEENDPLTEVLRAAALGRLAELRASVASLQKL